MKLHEEFKLYENMWDEPVLEESSKPFDENIFKACLDRVTASAAEYAEPTIESDLAGVYVKLSAEDLKKALKIGSRGTFTDPSKGKTIPAQLVDMVSLEILRPEEGEGICYVLLELFGEGEETGETSHDYNDGDVPFVGEKQMNCGPIETNEAFADFVKNNIIPKADQLAHEIIDEAWKASGFSDYAGITDYTPSDDISEDDFFNDDFEDDSEQKDWEALLRTADSLLAKLASSTGNARADDGDGYWQTEYTTWCFRYLYHHNLTNIAGLDKACEEYSDKLPGVEFYYVDDEDCSEIGYVVERSEDNE